MTFWIRASNGKTPTLLVSGTNCTLTGDYSATCSSNNTFKQFTVYIKNVTGDVTLTFKHNSPSVGSYIHLDDILIVLDSPLASVSVKTPPTKTKYKVGERPVLTGLVLLATYENGKTRSISSDYTVSPSALTALTISDDKLTIMYEGKSCEQPITVGELTSITYNSASFAHTSYIEGDSFNPGGLVVTAHYSNSDGYDEVVADYTLSPSVSTALTTADDEVVVSYTWNAVIKSVTIPITVSVGPKYTVTFNAETGTCDTPSLVESSYRAGVVLPVATSSTEGWKFFGWATETVTNTSTRPTLFKAGTTYYPSENTTLHAVYSLRDYENKFQLATSNSDIVDGARVIIFSLGTNKYTLANNNGTLTGIANFTPTDGIIECDNSQAVWTLRVSDGNVVLSNCGLCLKRSSTTVSLAETSSNWTIFKSSYGTNRFLVKDANTKYYLKHDGTSWTVQNTSITESSSNNYFGLTVYVEAPTAYNSNPAGPVINPTVAFASTGSRTLYLDGTTTYRNTATVTGIDKTVTYTSSNSSVATVASDGTVTAVGVGTATITAKVDVELGVNNAARDTYTVVVKNTSTVAGIYACSAGSFEADLTDAVVTYVDGDYAYLQDASGAVSVVAKGHGLTAGKSLTGSVSGTLTNSSGQKYISAITVDATDADGEIPAAETVTLAQIVAAGSAYEGRLVTVRGATVTTGMADDTKNGVISDDGEATSFGIVNPNKMTLSEGDFGIFTGFVSIKDDAYRLRLFEDAQFRQAVAVAVSAAGLATYADDNALDYTDVDGLEAYVAKEEAAVVKLVRVKKVPAATGVLLRSTDGETHFVVPVLTSSADDIAGNQLVRGAGVAVESGSGPYNYILNIVDGVLGFYRAAGKTVATNRAYLQTSASAGTRLSISFDDEVTGIITVNDEPSALNRYYDLQGQSVVNPQSGRLYIVNGRKVVMK